MGRRMKYLTREEIEVELVKIQKTLHAQNERIWRVAASAYESGIDIKFAPFVFDMGRNAEGMVANAQTELQTLAELLKMEKEQ